MHTVLVDSDNKGIIAAAWVALIGYILIIIMYTIGILMVKKYSDTIIGKGYYLVPLAIFIMLFVMIIITSVLAGKPVLHMFGVAIGVMCAVTGLTYLDTGIQTCRHRHHSHRHHIVYNVKNAVDMTQHDESMRDSHV